MSSKQTDSKEEKKQIPNDWMPASAARTRLAKPTIEQIGEDVAGTNPINCNASNESSDIDETIRQESTSETMDGLQIGAERLAVPKRTSSKQRKESLEEYRQTFLRVAKLEDRKPIFVSREVRDRIDEIVHRLGGRGRSVSGFIENLARHHLEMYQDDVELWKKL